MLMYICGLVTGLVFGFAAIMTLGLYYKLKEDEKKSNED